MRLQYAEHVPQSFEDDSLKHPIRLQPLAVSALYNALSKQFDEPVYAYGVRVPANEADELAERLAKLTFEYVKDEKPMVINFPAGKSTNVLTVMAVASRSYFDSLLDVEKSGRNDIWSRKIQAAYDLAKILRHQILG